MFLRVKTTPNSPRRSVQLVESVRWQGPPTRHLAMDELVRLKQLGAFVKAKNERQPLLLFPEQIAEGSIRIMYGRSVTNWSSGWASTKSTARCTGSSASTLSRTRYRANTLYGAHRQQQARQRQAT